MYISGSGRLQAPMYVVLLAQGLPIDNLTGSGRLQFLLCVIATCSGVAH